MQTSENAPKVEGVPNVESAPNVESTEYRSGFYREAGFYDAHSLPDYGAQSPVTREAFAYDFFPATADISSPAPLLVWVHGGAWRFGTNQALRDTVLRTPGGEQPNTQALMRAAFQQAGWAVASINYRYSHQALFPGALHDVKEAVRFFRANAQEFGIDPQRIAVAGGSAGGHLSMLVAHTGDSALENSAVENHTSAPEHAELTEYFEGRAASAYPSHSSRVAAAASFYGVSDLRTIFTDRPLAGYALDHPEDDGAEWRLLGSTHPVPADVSTIDVSAGERAVPGVCIERAQKNWERAHPIDAARPQKLVNQKRVNKFESASEQGANVNATPLMLVHGISDSCVPYQQSVRVYQALRTRQVPTDLVLVPDAEHGDSRCFSPDIVQQMLQFFNRTV